MHGLIHIYFCFSDKKTEKRGDKDRKSKKMNRKYVFCLASFNFLLLEEISGKGGAEQDAKLYFNHIKTYASI